MSGWRWVVEHPRTMLAAGVLAVALATFTMVRWFHVNPDVSSLFPTDDETLKLTRSLQGDAGPSRTLFVIVRADTPEAIDAALPAAVERLRASEHVARVVATREEFSGGRFAWMRRAPLGFMPADTLDALEARLTMPGRQEQIQALRRRIAEDPIGGKKLALADPLGVRWAFAEAEATASARWPAPMMRGSPYVVFTHPPVAFIRVVGKRDSFDVPFSNTLVDDVRARLDGLRFELAGGYVSASWNAARMERDMKVQVVISAILVVAFLWVFTRSVVGAHVMIAPVGAALVCTLALGTAVVGPLTPLAVGVIAVMIGMGIDYPIHVFARYRDERVSQEPRPAMEQALRSLGRPFLGAVATTTAPLLTLLLSGFPGFRQFGGLLAAGIAVSVALSLTALVPMLLGVDRFVRPKARYEPWVVRLAARMQSRTVAVVVGVLAVGAWMVVATGEVAIDLDLRNVMAQGDPGVAALERLEGDLGFAMTPVIALVDRPVGASVPGAAAVTGAHDLVPTAEARARVERLQASTVDWHERTIAELKAAGFNPDPFRPALTELGRILASEPLPLAALDEPEFAALRASLRYGDAWVVTIVPKRALWRPAERRVFDTDVRAALGGGTKLYSAYHLPDHSVGLLKRDLGRVGWWSLAAVVVMAVLSTGSVRGGLLALVPMVAGVGFVLSLCRLFGMPLNFFNFEALPILMGTGIDHGIYFVTHRDEHPRQSVAEAIRETGPGMWGTMASTLLGFGAIAFSSQPGLATMGLLVVAGMSAAFAATLLLLPALTGGSSDR